MDATATSLIRSKIERLIQSGTVNMSARALLVWAHSYAPDAVQDLERMIADVDRLVDNVTSATLLAPHGWAFSSRCRPKDYGNAADLVVVGSIVQADELLCDSWDRVGHRASALRLRTLGSWNSERSEVSRHRGDLVTKAITHHDSGDYDSAVPMVLAQVEGITADYSNGKMFFTRTPSRQADVVNEALLSTISENLAVVRNAFSKPLGYSTIEPTMSRHGVLHGRSVGYGTRTYSTKCLALLSAAIDWAQALDSVLAAE